MIHCKRCLKEISYDPEIMGWRSATDVSTGSGEICNNSITGVHGPQIRIGQLEEMVFEHLRSEGFEPEPELDCSTTHFLYSLVKVMKNNRLIPRDVIE